MAEPLGGNLGFGLAGLDEMLPLCPRVRWGAIVLPLKIEQKYRHPICAAIPAPGRPLRRASAGAFPFAPEKKPTGMGLRCFGLPPGAIHRDAFAAQTANQNRLRTPPPSLRSGSDFLKKSKMNRGRAKRGNWAPQRSWEASKLSSSKGRRPQPRSKSSEDAYHHPEFGPASMNKCAVPSHSTKSPASTASGPMKVMP